MYNGKDWCSGYGGHISPENEIPKFRSQRKDNANQKSVRQKLTKEKL